MLCVERNSAAHSEPALQIRQENPLTITDWDTRVSSHPQFSFFHSAAWAKVLARTYGFTPVYLAGWCGGQLLSLLPVMEVNSWLTGKRGVSLPFTDYCEPLGSSEVALRTLFEEALRQGRARGWKYLEYRGGAGLARYFQATSPSLTFFNHRLGLVPEIDLLFARFQNSIRRAIRKAEKQGLNIEISQTLPAIQAYYSLHCLTRKRHGQPPQPFRFFRNIHEEILARNRGVVVSARYQGSAVASAVFFFTDTEAIYKFGASNSAFQDFRANNLVMWEAIKWCARNGKKALDFGRVSITNEGLRRFKLGWGAEEHPICYYKFDLRTSRFVTEKDMTSGWQVGVFRLLPIAVARCLGAVLYRHIG